MQRVKSNWFLTAAFVGTAYLMWAQLGPGAPLATTSPRDAADLSEPRKPRSLATPAGDPFVARLDEQLSPEDALQNWRLEGVVLAAQPFALLNGRRVSEGAVVDGFTVERIASDHVHLVRDQQALDVPLGPVAAAGSARPAEPDGTPILSAVMSAGTRRLAIIDGQIVRLGESWGGRLLEEVRPDGVTLVRGDQRLELFTSRPDGGRPSAERSPE